MKKITLFFASLLTVLFVSCSSDVDDMTMGSTSKYQYSAEELQQIKNLQEEYGVSFEFAKSSDRPLASMKEIEDVCKLVASFNLAVKNVTVKGNTAYGTNKQKGVLRRGFSNAKEYSGSYKGTQNIDSYGSFDFEISWTNVNSASDKSKIEGKVLLITPTSGYSITKTDFDAEFVGSTGIDYTFYFMVAAPGGDGYKFSVKGSLTM